MRRPCRMRFARRASERLGLDRVASGERSCRAARRANRHPEGRRPLHGPDRALRARCWAACQNRGRAASPMGRCARAARIRMSYDAGRARRGSRPNRQGRASPGGPGSGGSRGSAGPRSPRPRRHHVARLDVASGSAPPGAPPRRGRPRRIATDAQSTQRAASPGPKPRGRGRRPASPRHELHPDPRPLIRDVGAVDRDHVGVTNAGEAARLVQPLERSCFRTPQLECHLTLEPLVPGGIHLASSPARADAGCGAPPAVPAATFPRRPPPRLTPVRRNARPIPPACAARTSRPRRAACRRRAAWSRAPRPRSTRPPRGQHDRVVERVGQALNARRREASGSGWIAIRGARSAPPRRQATVMRAASALGLPSASAISAWE